MLYNFPFKVRVAGEVVFPTVAKLPDWATNAAYRNAVAMPGKPEIKAVGRSQRPASGGLPSSQTPQRRWTGIQY